jgi:hypothetical protein
MPEDLSGAAETCDEVLETIALSEGDQGLARKVIDERLHRLGSVAAQPRAVHRPPLEPTAVAGPPLPLEPASAEAGARPGRRSLNLELILCLGFSVGVWVIVSLVVGMFGLLPG